MSYSLDVNIIPKDCNTYSQSNFGPSRLIIIKSKTYKSINNISIRNNVFKLENPSKPEHNVINQLLQTNRISDKGNAFLFTDCEPVPEDSVSD